MTTRDWTRRRIWLLLGILSVGLAVRVAWVGRPFDHRLVNPWRQADYYQIARNFHRESGHLFYPRVDWRGDTPGYAEMELPIVPWTAARLFDLFGFAPQVFRALTAMLAVVNLGLLLLLARRMLRPPGVLAALAVFSVNPIIVVVSGSMQPETLMHGLLLVTALLLWSWWEEGRGWTLVAAGGAMGLAILTKLPAAHMGLLFAWIVIRRVGLKRALGSPQVLLAAALALAPPFAWYRWAHGFWAAYGLSLGVSNESHWIGVDLLWPPWFLLAIVIWETVVAFTPTGWLLAAAAWRDRGRTVEFLTAWYVATVVFYVVAARTTTDTWAFYYHILSVAPAALLMGAGFDRFETGAVLPTRWNVGPGLQRAGGRACIAAAVLVFVSGSAVLIHKRDSTTAVGAAMYACSLELAEVVPENELIVVRGGRMVDDSGRPVAHNESMVFAWMDRRGFTYGVEELSIETLDAIARRGGRFWFVAASDIGQAGLEEEVAARYELVGACRDLFLLFDITGAAASGGQTH